MTNLIANKPWILIILGFFLLISVWVFFFIVAMHNQPERLPLSQAAEPTLRQASLQNNHPSSLIIHTFNFPSWT